MNKALEIARDGDALVVWKLDRIGRSLPHVVGVVSDLQKRGVSLKVVTGDVDGAVNLNGSRGESSAERVAHRTGIDGFA